MALDDSQSRTFRNYREGDTDVARIPYSASPEQYEELIRNIRLPYGTVRTSAFGMLTHTPAIGGSVLKLIHSITLQTSIFFYTNS